MGTWTLHIVGEELEDFVHQLGNDIVKLLEERGHSLVSAQLGTDKGTVALDTSPPDEHVEETPDVPVDTPPSLPDDPVSAAVAVGITP